MAKKKFQRVSFNDAKKMLKNHIFNSKNAIEMNNCPYGIVVYLSEKDVLKILKKITR